jgi:hypothetical protein
LQESRRHRKENQPESRVRHGAPSSARNRRYQTVVVDGQSVAGIFTRNDALRTLDDLAS